MLYDKIANRWVFAQASVSTNPSLECVAVSTSSDATGTFNLYSFSDPGVIIDYAKLGLWTDAYYAAYNTYDPDTQAFLGANICAYDSLSMQSGLSATQDIFPAVGFVHYVCATCRLRWHHASCIR